jgi:hypothetical protein
LALQASTFARLSTGGDLMGGPGGLGDLALPSRKLQYDWMLGELLRLPARNDMFVDFGLLLLQCCDLCYFVWLGQPMVLIN